MSFFSFPDDARWNDKTGDVEFSVAIGEYEGTVRVAARVIRGLSATAKTPEQYLEAYHLHRTWFERAAEAKLRRRELAPDGNVDLTGRDLRRDLRKA